MTNFSDYETKQDSPYFDAESLSQPVVGRITEVGDTKFPMFKDDNGEPDESGPLKPWIRIDALPKPMVVNWTNLKVLKIIANSDRLFDLVGKCVAVDKVHYKQFDKYGLSLRQLSRIEYEAMSKLKPGEVATNVKSDYAKKDDPEFSDEIPF